MPHVRGHYRLGRWVRPHRRRSPNKAFVVLVVAFFVLVVILVLTHGNL